MTQSEISSTSGISQDSANEAVFSTGANAQVNMIVGIAEARQEFFSRNATAQSILAGCRAILGAIGIAGTPSAEELSKLVSLRAQVAAKDDAPHGEEKTGTNG